jgi:hypothetical protein
MSIKTSSFRLKADVLQIVKQIALSTKQSQSSVVSTAIQMLADSGDIKADVKHDESTSLIDYFKQEIKFKNQEIEKLLETVQNQTQLLGMASKKEILLLETKPSKKNRTKSVKEVDITPKGSNSTTSSKKKGGKKKHKKKKKK